MEKYCRQCGQDVRVADFYRHPNSADGYMPICKACHRANVRANYQQNRERFQEYERGRVTPENSVYLTSTRYIVVKELPA